MPCPAPALAAGVSVSGRANVCNGSLADVLELDERDSRQITTKSCPRNQTFNGLQRCEPFLFDRAGNGLGQTTASVMILVSRPTDRRQSTSVSVRRAGQRGNDRREHHYRA